MMCICPGCGALWPFTIEPGVFVLTLLALQNDKLRWREEHDVLELWEEDRVLASLGVRQAALSLLPMPSFGIFIVDDPDGLSEDT